MSDKDTSLPDFGSRVPCNNMVLYYKDHSTVLLKSQSKCVLDGGTHILHTMTI